VPLIAWLAPFTVVPVVSVVAVPLVPDIAVPIVSVLDVPVIAVLLIAVPDVSVDDVLLIAVPEVSLVVIVDEVSLTAVSVTFVFSSFLQANANKARAVTTRMASVLFITFPFTVWGWNAEECELITGCRPSPPARSNLR
jgi:hypothetical protein